MAEKFKDLMTEAIAKAEAIECTPRERVAGLNHMSEILVEAYILADEVAEEAEQNNVISLASYRMAR